MSDVFLVYFLIAFEYLKTAFYFINTRYQIMMRCWKSDPDARQTLTDSRNQLKGRKPYVKWGVTDSWWCFEIKGWWNWLNQRRKWFKWNITRLKPWLTRGKQLDGHKLSMPSYAVSSEIGNKSESKFPKLVPSASVSSFAKLSWSSTKIFCEIEIRETNNYQLLRNFEEIEFENKMTPCLLGSHFKILGSQFTRRLSVGVDSARKTIIRNNLEGGSSRRLSVTRVNLYLCWSGRCFNQQGKRREKRRKEVRQRKESYTANKTDHFNNRCKAKWGSVRRDSSRISAYGNFDRNGLWPLHLLS